MMHCCIESIFSFSSLFCGKKFQSEIQIGITFEWIGVFRCGFQQSLSHNNFYYLKCLVKNLFLPFQLIFKLSRCKECAPPTPPTPTQQARHHGAKFEQFW